MSRIRFRILYSLTMCRIKYSKIKYGIDKNKKT